MIPGQWVLPKRADYPQQVHNSALLSARRCSSVRLIYIWCPTISHGWKTWSLFCVAIRRWEIIRNVEPMTRNWDHWRKITNQNWTHSHLRLSVALQLKWAAAFATHPTLVHCFLTDPEAVRSAESQHKSSKYGAHKTSPLLELIMLKWFVTAMESWCGYIFIKTFSNL